MSSTHRLPVPSVQPRAELIGEALARRLLEVGSLAHLVAIVLSRFVGEHRAKSCGDMVMLERTLLLYANHAGAELDVRPTARHLTVVSERGETRATLRLRWRQLRGEHGIVAVLDPELLLSLFPPAVWRALALLVTHGPSVAAAVADRLLHSESAREVRPTRRRPEGGLLSRPALQQEAWVLNAVMATLVDLHKRGVRCAELDEWTHAVRVVAPEAPGANTDTSAPAWRLVRLAWQQLDGRIKQCLGARTDEDELRVVRSCSVFRLRDGGVWLAMRQRAMLAQFAMLGGRVGAITSLRRTDLELVHQCPDGQMSPAIALRSGKTSPDGEVCYKPIPSASTWCVEVLFIVTDRLLAETPDYTRAGRIARPLPPEDLAMFPKSLREPGRSLSAAGFRAAIVGWDAGRGRKARAPMLPRQNGGGHTPHSLRGAVMQMLEREAQRYCEQQRLPYKPQDIPEALVDHGTMSDDQHGYYDRDTGPGREILSRIATSLAWPALTTDHGARTTRDGPGYRTALKQRHALHREWDLVQAEIAATMGHSHNNRRAASVLLEIRALDEQRDAIRARLAEVEQRIERLRHDPATRVPVSDDIPDQDLIDRFDEIEQEINGQRHQATQPELARSVRAWITVPETPTIFEISYPQGARWVKNQNLPHPPGDPRNPWRSYPLLIDESLGPRRRRIPVSEINPAYLCTPAQRARLARILADWPQGWSTAHCLAPVQLPDSAARQLK